MAFLQHTLNKIECINCQIIVVLRADITNLFSNIKSQCFKVIFDWFIEFTRKLRFDRPGLSDPKPIFDWVHYLP